MSYVRIPEKYWVYFLNAEHTQLRLEKILRFYNAINMTLKYDIIKTGGNLHQAYFGFFDTFNWADNYNFIDLRDDWDHNSDYSNVLGIIHFDDEGYQVKDVELGVFKISLEKSFHGKKLFFKFNSFNLYDIRKKGNRFFKTNEFKGYKEREFLDHCKNVLRQFKLQEKFTEDQRIATELVVTRGTNKTIPSIGRNIMDFAGLRLPGTFPPPPPPGQDYPSVLRRLHEARLLRKRRRD